MNPLSLKDGSRRMYEALVELHHTDIDDKEVWLKRYRKVKLIIKVEGLNALMGWKYFHFHYAKDAIPIEIAEQAFRRAVTA